MADAFITVTGNIGKTPELAATRSGVPVISASIAATKRKRTGDGPHDFEDVHTTWYEALWYREDAEAVAAMGLDSGDTIRVSGETYLDEYTRRDGTTGAGMKIIADGTARRMSRPKRDRSAAPPQGDGWGGYQQGVDRAPY